MIVASLALVDNQLLLYFEIYNYKIITFHLKREILDALHSSSNTNSINFNIPLLLSNNLHVSLMGIHTYQLMIVLVIHEPRAHNGIHSEALLQSQNNLQLLLNKIHLSIMGIFDPQNEYKTVLPLYMVRIQSYSIVNHHIYAFTHDTV